MDALGHVNNVNYYRYLEEARIRHFEEMGPEFFEGGLLLAHAGLDFRVPLVHRLEPVAVELAVEKISNRSWTYANKIFDSDRVYAEGRTVMVVTDAAGKPRQLREIERELLGRYQA